MIGESKAVSACGPMTNDIQKQEARLELIYKSYIEICLIDFENYTSF